MYVCKRMQQRPTMLGPAVLRGKDTTQEDFADSKKTMFNARSWPRECWKSCANGSNIVALRFCDHGTKEMLGVLAEKFYWFQTLRNDTQQHPPFSCILLLFFCMS